MWIAEVFFFLLFATERLLRLSPPSSYFPPLVWRCRDLLPRLPGLMGTHCIGGYTKRTSGRALMAPRPVEKCSVLYEPGARRHALESDVLGGVKAYVALHGAKDPAVVYTATVVVHKYLRGCSEWREAVLMAHSPSTGIRYLAVWFPIGQVRRLLPEGRS